MHSALGRIYEEKYDGWRILAFRDGEYVRLISRNGRDHAKLSGHRYHA